MTRLGGLPSDEPSAIPATRTVPGSRQSSRLWSDGGTPRAGGLEPRSEPHRATPPIPTPTRRSRDARQHMASDHARSTRLARGLKARGDHQASADTAAQQSLGDHHQHPACEGKDNPRGLCTDANRWSSVPPQVRADMTALRKIRRKIECYPSTPCTSGLLACGGPAAVCVATLRVQNSTTWPLGSVT
jgi:hypothetical protein